MGTQTRRDERPTWVATGPILPGFMAIAVFIAAVLNPTAIAIWIAFGLCVFAVVAIIAIHFSVVRQNRKTADSR